MTSLEFVAEVKIVDLSITDRHSCLLFVFGAVLLLELLALILLYLDAVRRDMDGQFWAGIPFFLTAILITAAIATGSLSAWVVLSIAALITTPIFISIYLFLRRGGRVCPLCGRKMEREWTCCPHCLATISEVVSSDSEPAPVFVPPGESAVSEGKRVTVRHGLIEHGETVQGGLIQSDLGAGWLVVREGQGVGREFRISKDTTTIGRAGTNDIMLADEEVSRRHAEVSFQDGEYYLMDLDSSNGTYVNGEPVKEMLIEDGDLIRFGQTELVFKKI